MSLSLVVLTDFFAVANRALAYAAGLAVPLHARLVLLHVRHNALPVPPGSGYRHSLAGERQTDRALQQLAAAQPVPTAVEVAEAFMADALLDVAHRQESLLMVMARLGSAAAPSPQLTETVMALLRETPHPLLLVPEAGAEPELPRRLLLATDGEPFRLHDLLHQRVLNQLLHATGGILSAVLVGPHPQAHPNPAATATAIRTACMVDDLPASRHHAVRHHSVVEGVLAEAARQQADLLVVVARHHSLLGSLFHRSVTAQLIEQSPIPVLVLPAQD